MKECWLNVYQGDDLVRFESWPTRNIAVLYSYPHIKVLYRIHVKMDGGYNKYPLRKPWAKVEWIG